MCAIDIPVSHWTDMASRLCLEPKKAGLKTSLSRNWKDLLGSSQKGMF